jgi:hypothetical protein
LSKLADDYDDIWELSLFWWIYIPAELRLPEGLEVPFCYWNLVRRARHGIGYSRNSSPRLLERRLHYLDELVVLQKGYFAFFFFLKAFPKPFVRDNSGLLAA